MFPRKTPGSLFMHIKIGSLQEEANHWWTLMTNRAILFNRKKWEQNLRSLTKVCICCNISQRSDRKDKQFAVYPLPGIRFWAKITGFRGKTTMLDRENDSSLIPWLHLSLLVFLCLVTTAITFCPQLNVNKNMVSLLWKNKNTSVFQELGTEESLRKWVSWSFKADNELKKNRAIKGLCFSFSCDSGIQLRVCKPLEFQRLLT